MTPAAKVGLVLAGGALVGAAALYDGESTAPGPAPSAPASVTVEAAPRELDEGELVELAARVTEAGEDGFAFHEYRWDFGDGSPGSQGTELSDVRHRFADDGSYRVAVRVGNDEASVSVRVRNVAPTIRRLETLVSPRPGDPIAFDVTATDPGLRDELSYHWSFGDGTEQQGTSSSVSHRYDTAGFYTAEVVVDDGDGGVDRASIQVLAHAPFGASLSGEVNATIVGGGNDRPRAMLQYQQPLRTPDVSLFSDATTTTGAVANRDGCFLTIQMATGESDRRHVFAIGVEVRDGDLLPGGYPVVPTSNIWPACDTPGMRCPVRHGFVNGSATITRVGPDGVEGHADLSTEFSPGAQTRMTATFATGPVFQEDGRCAIDTDVETFDIAARRPAADAQNVRLLDPGIEVTFTHPVSSSTIAGNVRLEYGRPNGGSSLSPLDYQAVPGTWELVPGDDHSIRFVPQARLLDGVIHCLRVRTGRDGLRGRRGEVLVAAVADWADRNRPACDASRPWEASREWAFSTLVELESANLHVYQSSLVLPLDPNAAPSSWLVAGKPSVARVYPHWTAKGDQGANGVHPFSQVTSFPARVSVRIGERAITAPRRTDIRRPDQFDGDDRKHARNSVNLFGWRPASQRGRADLHAVIEAIDETGETVQTFKSAVQRLPYWHDSPVLSFDYHFLRVNGCAGPLLEVPARTGARASRPQRVGSVMRWPPTAPSSSPRTSPWSRQGGARWRTCASLSPCRSWTWGCARANLLGTASTATTPECPARSPSTSMSAGSSMRLPATRRQTSSSASFRRALRPIGSGSRRRCPRTT